VTLSACAIPVTVQQVSSPLIYVACFGEFVFASLFSSIVQLFYRNKCVRGKSCGGLLGIQDANSGTAIAEPLDLTRWKEWRRERRDSLGIQNAKVVFKKRTVNVKECQRTLMSKSNVTYANAIKFHSIN
jgi:hypothetical protein